MISRIAQRPLLLGASLGAGVVLVLAALVIMAGAWAVWPDIASYTARSSALGVVASIALVFLVFVVPAVTDVVGERAGSLAIGTTVLVCVAILRATRRHSRREQDRTTSAER